MDRFATQLDASLLWSCALNHKLRLIAVSTLVFCSICLAMLAMTPSYESTAVLIGGQPGLEPVQPGVKQSSDSGVSLAGIAESEEVVRAAIAEVGLDKLVDPSKLTSVSVYEKARQRLLRLRNLVLDAHFDLRFILDNAARYMDSENEGAIDYVSPSDAGFAAVSRAVQVKPEPNSDILRISFRHKDPAIAAALVNAMSHAFIARQAEIFSKSGAADFFQDQTKHFSDESKDASLALKEFMTSSGFYSVDDQRQLLLRRQNEIERALSTNRGLVAERTGEKQAFVNQLRRLAPVARSQFVSSVVNGLSDDHGEQKGFEAKAVDSQSIESPLLLVKVYQDSMAALFKADSDLAGLNKAMDEQGNEIEGINNELSRLSTNEHKYVMLKNAVDLAEDNRLMYARRMTSERIEAQSRAANIMAVKVVQKGTRPTSPVFPNYPLVTTLAVAVSLLIGFFAAARAGLQKVRVASRTLIEPEPYTVTG